MKINSNSFFFRRYLGYDKHSLWVNPHPKSVCDLVWRFIKRTILYYAILHVTIATLYSLIAIGPMPMWPRDPETLRVIYISGVDPSFLQDILIGLPSVIGSFAILCLVVLAIGIGVMYLGMIASEFVYDRIPESFKTKVADVKAGLTRKSCAIVIITDEKEDK